MIAVCHAPPYSTSLDRIPICGMREAKRCRIFCGVSNPDFFSADDIHQAAGAQDKLGATSAMNVGKKGYVLDLDQQAEWGQI